MLQSLIWTQLSTMPLYPVLQKRVSELENSVTTLNQQLRKRTQQLNLLQTARGVGPQRAEVGVCVSQYDLLTFSNKKGNRARLIAVACAVYISNDQSSSLRIKVTHIIVSWIHTLADQVVSSYSSSTYFSHNYFIPVSTFMKQQHFLEHAGTICRLSHFCMQLRNSFILYSNSFEASRAELSTLKELTFPMQFLFIT